MAPSSSLVQDTGFSSLVPGFESRWRYNNKDMAKENHSEKIISWRAAEYEHIERSPLWYLVVGGASLILSVFSLVGGNFFFAVFIILAFVMLIMLGRNKPRTLDYRLTDEGVGVGPKIFYHYDALEGFAVNDRPGRLDEIILKKKSVFNPYLKLPVDGKTAALAQKMLSEKLPVIDHQESLIDIFADWLGF